MQHHTPVLSHADPDIAVAPLCKPGGRPASRSARVYACCRTESDRHRLRALREWLHKTDERYCRGRIRDVVYCESITRAMTLQGSSDASDIVVTLGFEPAEVSEAIDAFAHRPPDHGPVICGLPREDTATSPPSSSPFAAPGIVVTSDLFQALRKALLRISARAFGCVRVLETRADIEASFRLRHRVWSEKGYLLPDRTSGTTPWEVDYTDRTALAVGLFGLDGSLAGCGRLVREVGNESWSYGPTAEALIAHTHDPVLAANFSYQCPGGNTGMRHPFDVLEEFAGFRNVYQQYVKTGTAVAEVSRVVLAREHRGRGFGEVVVDSLVSKAREIGIAVLFLACRQSSVPFYANCGFSMVPDLRSERFLTIPEVSVVMQLELG